jgi:hypothetical protein
MEIKEPEFFITELSTQDDTHFILGITDSENIERVYLVEVCVNSSGELVRLKSVKKS